MISSLAVDVPYWGQSLLRVLGGLVAVLLPAGTIVYLFLFKMMSFMQSRLGPMEAGPYGSMQLLAEVGKWLQKEDLAPENADVRIFRMAPLVVLVSTFLLVVIVPFGPDAYFTNFETGIFFGLAVSSVSVLGILIAGWASANKYSLLGGLRAAGQLIAYELPLVLATLGVVIQAGSMNLQDIVVTQNTGAIFGFEWLGNPFIITQFLGFLIFMVAVQAELTQPPFDMPIAESELVSGYMTEYSGFRFLIFFIAEFATAGVFAFIAAVLFLGGWGVPFEWFGWDGIDDVANWMNLVGPLIMFTKMLVLTFIIMWVRFSYPRFREDQLQTFAWKVLIPLALFNTAITAILKVAVVMPRSPVSSRVSASRSGPSPTRSPRARTPSSTRTRRKRRRSVPVASSPSTRATAPPACCAPARAPTGASTSRATSSSRRRVARGGKPRQVNHLDRFDIDYALCMYCGICVEVCPFDALFWSPEYEYSEPRIADLLHDKEKLGEWMQTVPEAPELEVGAQKK